MPFSEKHRGRSRSSSSHSPRQVVRQPPPAPPCTTAAPSTSRRNDTVRQSRSASRDENADSKAERYRQRSKSHSLEQQHIRDSAAETTRYTTAVPSAHRRGGGIPNISFGRRRGRSETPKAGEADGGKQRLHRSQQQKPTGRRGAAATGGVVNKFRSLSRSCAPDLSKRDKESGRSGSRTLRQQRGLKKDHQRTRSPCLEHQFTRRNTSNEARRKLDNAHDITLPIPKRGKSMPSRMKVSMQLSRDGGHHPKKKEINHHSSRSRSRHRSSSGRGGGDAGAIRSKSQSKSHGKKSHFTPGQEQLHATQHEKNPKSRHTHLSPNRKTSSHHRVRSKSMPIMGILRNGILLADKHQSIKYPVSTIASIDSSWRYKRIKMMKRLQRHKIQKQQQSRRQGRSSDDVYYEQERIRSISCDPSILRLALVPYHAKHPPSTTSITNNKSNTYLNYNLGEMDEELLHLLRQQRSRSSLDSTSLQWPSRISTKTRTPWGKSRRCCGVSTPTSAERSPRGKRDKFVTRSRSSERTGNGGDDLSYIISNGEADTDTTGWQGHAPDPVKSLHGSSYWAENQPRQRHTPTPSSSPLPDPLLVTSPSSPDDSRESFIGVIESDGGWSSGNKSKSGESSGEDKCSSERRESMSTRSSQNNDKDSGNSDSPESMLNNLPSSTVRNEKKINSGFLVPPLHSTVRSRKPKAKVVPISQQQQHHHHHRAHSHQHPINTKSGGAGEHSTSLELKSKSSDGIVEGMTITNKGSDSTTDHMSEVTMPFELSRAPPHEGIRSVKPQNRLHGHSSHPTSPVTKHPKSESHKHHPVGMSPQFLSALRAIHQVNTSLEHSNKSLEHPPKAAAAPLYPPPPPPPPPPRRMAPGPPPRNQYKHALNQQQQEQPQQQLSANNDIPLRQLQSQTLDDLYQSSTHLRSLRDRHHHSDRAFFPLQTSRDRYIEMTGGGNSGALHSSMKDLSKSNDSNIWQLQQFLNSSTTEFSRLRDPMLCPEEEGVGGQEFPVPPIPSIGGSTIARQRGKRVENMPYMDANQEMGLYTGETNELGQPHGKGKMKYDNGIFFEGKWTNGVQDGVGTSRERLLSGFTSWKGTAQSKKNGIGKEFAHGMIWVNPYNGRSGRYTGDLNQHGMPHGRGVMRYDFGLIAEGEWNNGKIIDDSFPGCPVPATLVGGNFSLAP